MLLDAVSDENALSTYNNGSKPIDSIMCSANINILEAGYVPFREDAGHHRTLTIDIE